MLIHIINLYCSRPFPLVKSPICSLHLKLGCRQWPKLIKHDFCCSYAPEKYSFANAKQLFPSQWSRVQLRRSIEREESTTHSHIMCIIWQVERLSQKPTRLATICTNRSLMMHHFWRHCAKIHVRAIAPLYLKLTLSFRLFTWRRGGSETVNVPPRVAVNYI